MLDSSSSGELLSLLKTFGGLICLLGDKSISGTRYAWEWILVFMFLANLFFGSYTQHNPSLFSSSSRRQLMSLISLVSSCPLFQNSHQECPRIASFFVVTPAAVFWWLVYAQLLPLIKFRAWTLISFTPSLSVIFTSTCSYQLMHVFKFSNLVKIKK